MIDLKTTGHEKAARSFPSGFPQLNTARAIYGQLQLGSV